MGTGEWAGSKRGMCPQPQLWVDCLTSSHPAPLLPVAVQPQELPQRASPQLWEGRRDARGSAAPHLLHGSEIGMNYM